MNNRDQIEPTLRFSVKEIYILFVIYFYSFFNDFFFKYIPSDFYLVIDYSTRVIEIFLIFSFLSLRTISLKYLASFEKIFLSVTSIIFCIILCIAIHVISRDLVPFDFLYEPFFGWSSLTNTFEMWVDLTFGLALVAFSEEILFRTVIFCVLCTRMPAWVALIVTSILFAGVHVGGGVSQILSTFLIGVVLQLNLIYFRSIWQPIIIHFCVNFIIFYFSYFPW